ncbi:hypothetical protein [Nisaea sp.]|uniref:hypothetical protein n=1 Tax=Nisaea sp. TaxID=2024842 RepID=UPI003B52D1F6
MSQKQNPFAPEHLPGYLAGPDGSDPLFTVTLLFLLGIIVLAGVAYFSLHAMPEHLAGKNNSTQLQLVGVLGLLALFTHNNLFWVLALLIAVIKVPDIATPIETISRRLGEFLDRQDANLATSPSPAPGRPASATDEGGTDSTAQR